MNLVSEKEAMYDADLHFLRYKDFLRNNLKGIIYEVSEGFLSVESHSIRPIKVQLSDPQRVPRKIPLKFKEKYCSYYISITVDVMVTMASDINYLKLKNYNLYNKLFAGFYFDDTFFDLKRQTLLEITETMTDTLYIPYEDLYYQSY